MGPLFSQLTEINALWYSLPLVIAVSLVYAATRDEAMRPILGHALRFGAWIVGFMLIVMAGLLFLSWLT